jgi:hypothetical protein
VGDKKENPQDLFRNIFQDQNLESLRMKEVLEKEDKLLDTVGY